jgi:hypothetical protein
MRWGLGVLLLVAAGCSGRGDSTKSITVKTHDGDVAASTTEVDSVPQGIEVLTGDMLSRTQSLGMRGAEFVAAYLPGTTNPDLKDYDRAFRVWQTSKSPQHTSEQVVEILGGYLGNKMIDDFDMEWVTVTDQYGTDYAVRHKKVELMGFPFSTVLKRIEKQEYDFMHGVYYTMKQTLESGEYKEREPESPK